MPISISGAGDIAGLSSVNSSVSAAEIGYLDGTTSAIQAQINDKWNTQTAWNDLAVGDITIWQGTTVLTKAKNYAKYLNFGKTIIFTASFEITSTGSAGNFIRVAAPVAPAIASAVTARGEFYYRDTGTAFYIGAALLLSDGIYGQAHNTANYIGAQPSFTAASSDIVSVNVIYEAA